MKKELIEKMKAAVAGKDAAQIHEFKDASELSFEELEGVAGGAEEYSEREAILWFLERGLTDAAWNYLETYHGIDANKKYVYVNEYGYEGGVRYVVDYVLHLS